MSMKSVFIGYSAVSKTYRFLRLHDNSVFYVAHAIFYEHSNIRDKHLNIQDKLNNSEHA